MRNCDSIILKISKLLEQNPLPLKFFAKSSTNFYTVCCIALSKLLNYFAALYYLDHLKPRGQFLDELAVDFLVTVIFLRKGSCNIIDAQRIFYTFLVKVKL